jgi:hypothetical protein
LLAIVASIVEFDIGSVAVTDCVGDIFLGEVISVLLESILEGSTPKFEFFIASEERRLLSKGELAWCNLFSCMISGRVGAQDPRFPIDIYISKF